MSREQQRNSKQIELWICGGGGSGLDLVHLLQIRKQMEQASQLQLQHHQPCKGRDGLELWEWGHVIHDFNAHDRIMHVSYIVSLIIPNYYHLLRCLWHLLLIYIYISYSTPCYSHYKIKSILAMLVSGWPSRSFKFVELINNSFS